MGMKFKLSNEEENVLIHIIKNMKTQISNGELKFEKCMEILLELLSLKKNEKFNKLLSGYFNGQVTELMFIKEVLALLNKPKYYHVYW